jgi:hypothetical protein
MKKELAQQVEHLLRVCCGLLDHTVGLVKDHASEEEQLKYRMAAAHVFGELLWYLVAPIYKEHPELDPFPSKPKGEQPGQSSKEAPQVENRPDVPDPEDPNKELAAGMACVLHYCSSLINHTVWLMDNHGTEAESQRHRQAVARVMAELETQILRPIYNEYPNLDPSSPTFDLDSLAESPGELPRVENHSELRDPDGQKS